MRYYRRTWLRYIDTLTSFASTWFCVEFALKHLCLIYTAAFKKAKYGQKFENKNTINKFLVRPLDVHHSSLAPRASLAQPAVESETLKGSVSVSTRKLGKYFSFVHKTGVNSTLLVGCPIKLLLISNMALNPAYEAIGKGFVQQYYALFDDPNQRPNLANMYNVSIGFAPFRCLMVISLTNYH